MCGIAGIVDFRSRTDKRQVTEQMLTAISYRGPDESGIYNSTFAALGNVRLSIIDISSGQQPLSDHSRRYWITFNGEIFNYRELREELEKKGIVFTTHSDTEVLVQLYALYGRQCLQKLNGQFAFAIWDRQEEELFLARDRVGIRPFFYSFNDGAFSFASEIKALLRQKNIKAEFNYEGLVEAYTFWTTITPNTIFKNISELSPGYYGIFSRKGFRTISYWNLCFDCNRQSVSLSDAVGGFNELFTDAVRIRLRADVEVAAYLSGGIDSSATVAYIKELEPGILNTFSIGFNEKSFDESSYQELAVKYFNTRHSQYLCTSDEIAGIFPNVVWHSEIPLTRTAPAPMFLLSKLVRQNNIKVVVTGEGSDELLGGYDIFKEALIRRFWATRPDSKIRPLLLKRLYQYIPQIANANLATIRMFFKYKLEDTGNPFYSHLLRWNNSNHIKRHLSENMREQTISFSPESSLAMRLPEGFESWDALSKAQWLETTVFMSGYLLSSQGDRMSMANSVEGRYPFLDYRVIEFCNSLPSSLKIKGLTEKYLLKKLLRNRIPEEILTRTKQPYRAPVSNVFLTKNPPDYVNEMLSEEYIRKAGIFDTKSVHQVISRIRKSEITSEVDDMLLTAVISSHLVNLQFIENRNEAFRPARLNNLRIIEDHQLLEVPEMNNTI
jgi:asparagine synthase (glutamine-hydrolysing)